MSQLNRVCGTRSRRDGGTKTEHESPTDKPAQSRRGPLDSGTDENNETSNEDAPSPTEAVGKHTTEGERGNLAQVVDNEYNPLCRTLTTEAKALLVRLHGFYGSHERAVFGVVSNEGGGRKQRGESSLLQGAANSAESLQWLGNSPKPFIVETR